MDFKPESTAGKSLHSKASINRVGIFSGLKSQRGLPAPVKSHSVISIPDVVVVVVDPEDVDDDLILISSLMPSPSPLSAFVAMGKGRDSLGRCLNVNALGVRDRKDLAPSI